ncbi:MAG TPA: PQQ-dependent sugar dehydrogenase [Chthoniobacterales bacterium]|nr:PQQ-dependent sugar dehydrogenase [Chthoniobacterales bacterium]
MKKGALICLAALGVGGHTAMPQALPAMDTVTVASGFSNPVFVTAPPGDYDRVFVVEQKVTIDNQANGRIQIVNLQTGAKSVFLTVPGIASGGEQGLLGLAFDPDYATNGKFYILYTAAGSGDIVVEQYQVSADPNVADTTPANIKTVITFPHPQGNHNAGWIGFSPRPNDDHNLYISSGDGGNGDDAGSGHHEPGGNAQWTGTGAIDATDARYALLGKMLRIHVNPATGGYTIPADNPLAGSTDPFVQKEIWLLGLRNPYRDSFDRLTGRMFIGDVGQGSREEVDVQQPANPGGGENYGWRDREGFIQNPTYATATPTPTPNPPRVDPILDYPRSGAGPIVGTTVTGGYVYRGRQIPGLRGTYIFGDYSAGKIFSLNYDGTTVTNAQTITGLLFPTIDATPQNLGNPSSFGEDANGELYISDLFAGRVYKIIPVTPNVELDSIMRIGTNFILHGYGVPFQTHTVRAVTDMTQPFDASKNIGTVTAGADGSFQFTDASASSFGRRFYRVMYP